MIDRHTQSEAARRALREQLKYSTDPEWVRQQMGEHQFSRTFIVVALLVGVLAFYGVFAAIASI
jgi:hypothetical protein